MVYTTNGKCWICDGHTHGYNGPALDICDKCFRAKKLIKSWGIDGEGQRLIAFHEEDGQQMLRWIEIYKDRLIGRKSIFLNNYFIDYMLVQEINKWTIKVDN